MRGANGVKASIAAATAAMLNAGLRAVGKNFRADVLGRLRALPPKPQPDSVASIELTPASFGFVTADPADRPIIERIVAAYRRAKHDQQRAPAVYRPSSLWQHHLDTAFAELARDTDAAAHFLANFGIWPIDMGIEGSATLFHTPEGRAQFRDIFVPMLRFWRLHHQHDRPLDVLTYPRFGNQGGAIVEGVFIGLGAPFSDVHSSVLRGIMPDVPRPVIAEIGGGWAKVFYFLTRKLAGDWCYVDFDLPEPLCCAAYYFMKAFPQKRVLLYGESGVNARNVFRDHDEASATLRDYDLIFLPPFAIEQLPDDSVDLFMNKNSLGEMRPDTARNYIAHVARTTRGWFWHINHDFVRNGFDDGSVSLLGREYELPADRFQRVHRYFEIGHALANPNGNISSDIYGYLYQRR